MINKFKQLSDNVKFFMGLAIYVVYMTWWAATITSTVKHNSVNIEKTLLALNTHVTSCQVLREKELVHTQEIEHLKKEIEELQLLYRGY